MKVGQVDTTKRVALVAEVGNNHEGSLSRAEELIETAFAAGADAVKLQTFVPELYVSVAETERLQKLRQYSLPVQELQALLERFSSRGLTVFSTPFDLLSLGRLSSSPLIKISSGDITFVQLLKGAAQTRRDIIISSGASTLSEVTAAVKLIESTWAELDHRGSVAILHCVSAYPAPHDSLNLRAISTLMRAFPSNVVGYSDHALGIDGASAAVLLGATIIEKHFTLAKDYSSFRDHQLSANPQEFAMLRERIDELQKMMGNGDKVPQSVESEMRMTIRRSICLTRSLPAGSRLEAEDLCVVRPGFGLPPERLGEIVGRVLRRSAEAGHILAEGDML